LRVLNTGQVAVNSTTTFPTSTFYSKATLNNNAVDGNAAGTGDAVYGQQTGTGNGVAGLNSSTGKGVYGVHIGTTTGYGVYGYSSGAAGSRGVFGSSDNTTGTGIAVKGQTNGLGTAVVGVSLNTAGGDGVYGYSSSSNAAMGGVFFNGATGGTGVIAGGNNVASMFYPTQGAGGAFTGKDYGVYGFAVGSAATSSAGGYFRDSLSAAINLDVRVAARNAGTSYKIIGTGTVSTIVKDLKGNDKVMFCPESPEALHEDYGTAQLVNGYAQVTLDPIYAKSITVNTKHELRVFIQLEGDCNGVFVTNKTKNGFEVKELSHGTSNVKFSYHVIGNRADEYVNGQLASKYEDLRFPDGPKDLGTHAKKVNKEKLEDAVQQPTLKQLK